VTFIVIARSADGKLRAIVKGSDISEAHLVELASEAEAEAHIGSFDHAEPDEEIVQNWQIVKVEI
jgi:hypothetical protein